MSERELLLYNTRTRRKERFEPLRADRVGIYSCGPTVYSRQHVGNLRAYLFADLLNRVLRFEGYRVLHVINITDVGHLTDDADLGDDKMELAARQSGRSAWEIAEQWTRVLQEDLRKLRVEVPDVWCKATEHIPEQIELIRSLEQKGYTYRVDDGIYFDTSKDPHYGELARLRLDEQRVQERIEAAVQKRNSADFALWKLSPAEGPRRQMEWESPWGPGFPGWHVECSAMSSKYLGVPFDIHTGGVDHIPVHHTNEIAQSEAAFEVRPWVRTWMHEEFWLFADQKISKSTGGGIHNLDEVERQGFEPMVLRYFFLQAHYRQQQNFAGEALLAARNAWRRLVRLAEEWQASGEEGSPERAAELRESFGAAVRDDLNAPQALAVVWEMARTDAIGPAQKAGLLREWDAVLGLGVEDAARAQPESDARIEALLLEREAARRARDFGRADALRAQLAEEGIVLEDGPSGTRWRRA
jgi:cysteinyl-tRNA synthetase